MTGPLFAEVGEQLSRIALSGKLDAAGHELFARLLDELRAAACPGTVIDLERLEGIEVAGVEALVAFSAALAQIGCTASVLAPRSGPVCMLLRAAGAADLLRAGA